MPDPIGVLHNLTVPAPLPDVTTFRVTRLVLVDLMTGALPLADALADGERDRRR